MILLPSLPSADRSSQSDSRRMPRRTSVGNADRDWPDVQPFFFSFPAGRLVIPWFGLFARIVLRVAFLTCIAFAGRTDLDPASVMLYCPSGVDAPCFLDLVYFLFLVSKSFFSIFIRS